MSGLNNLRTRLQYQGGVIQEHRMQKGKEYSLKKALLYSYQAATAILSDGREFKCLINSDKTKPDYDAKIISIPYKNVCIGRVDKNGKEIINNINEKAPEEEIGIKCGDVFKWKETNTYWLVYLEKLEEDAYFRAEIYKCEEEIILNGKKYHIYVRGPVETTIQWNKRQEMAWNDLNYSLIMYITKDEYTLNYFHRFKQIKIGNKNWEVKTVDPYSADGVIEICLGEYFTNELDDKYKEFQKEKEKDAKKPPEGQIYIKGDKIVYPYETHEYIIFGLSDGKWVIDNPKKAIFVSYSNSSVVINFKTGKSGKVNLKYVTKDGSQFNLPIEIRSI